MAENETTEETSEETPDEGSSKDSGPIKQLRAAEKAAREEATEFRTLLMEGAYSQVGLNPDEGLGKAIAKEYKGKPTATALAEFALEEYNYTAPAGQDHPQGAQIVTAQTQLDSAAIGAGSVALPTEADALAKAEAEGDTATTMAIKGAQVSRMMGQ